MMNDEESCEYDGYGGLLGLGNRARPMAKRLVDWPGGLIVFDVRAPKAMAPFAEAGATAADISPVAATADHQRDGAQRRAGA